MNDAAIFAFGFAAGAFTFAVAALVSAAPRIEDEPGYQVFHRSSHRGVHASASATGVVIGVQSQSGDHASFYSDDDEGEALGGACAAAPVSYDRGRPVLYLVASND